MSEKRAKEQRREEEEINSVIIITSDKNGNMNIKGGAENFMLFLKLQGLINAEKRRRRWRGSTS